MKQQTKKLALQLDTIRHLTDHGLRAIAGGLGPIRTETGFPPTLTNSRGHNCA